MKTSRVFTALAIILLSFSVLAHAGNQVVGVVQPLSQERISIMTGDKAAVNLGTRDGLVKGDIGLITLDRSAEPDRVVGKCAITKTGYDSSICEIIMAKREIEKGDYILFDSIYFSDENYYSLVMSTLANVVDPYEPYDHLRVCIYGFFDSRNFITGLSEQITKEFKEIFSQNNRIQLVNKDVLKNLIIYPDASRELLSFTRYEMRKNGIDVLVVGRYAASDERVGVTVEILDKTGRDRTVTFSFSGQAKYADLDSKIVLTPQEMTKTQTIPCNLVLRSLPRLVNREEKTLLIKSESSGNPLTERALKRIDFNIVSPVDVKAILDGETVAPVTKEGHGLMLSTGTHSMTTSFKRGYFFNETLLYTSDQEVIKDAMLDLTKDTGLVIEIRINASLQKDPINLTIYQPTERQHQVLKPIYRVESDKTVETFRD
jgi:hypothetical protein